MTKKILGLSLVLLFAVVLATGCGKKEETPEVPVVPEVVSETYGVDVENSTVAWSGEVVLVGEEHDGAVKIKEGELFVENGVVKSGSIVLDMSAIADNDLTDEDKTALEEKLNSEDFFDTANYSDAKLNIIDVQPVNGEEGNTTYNMVADLTIKDKTNSVSFPAQVIIADGVLTSTAEISIDCDDWNIGLKDEDSEEVAETTEEQTLKTNIKFNFSLKANVLPVEAPVVEEAAPIEEQPAE